VDLHLTGPLIVVTGWTELAYFCILASLCRYTEFGEPDSMP